MLYMIIEHFKNQDPVPVYRRFQDRGRLIPEGLQCVSSWVDEKLERCFQLMETERPQADEPTGAAMLQVALDRLADAVESALDMRQLAAILEESDPK